MQGRRPRISFTGTALFIQNEKMNVENYVYYTKKKKKMIVCSPIYFAFLIIQKKKIQETW